MSIKAYDELASLLLPEEDRQKFEWSVGCVLTGGPRRIVTFVGPPMSGKTTLETIVRKLLNKNVLETSVRVAFLNWDREIPHIDDDVFIFVEANTTDAIAKDSIVIHTVSGRLSADKHRALMRGIGFELVSIADHCINRYRTLGEDFYNDGN